jgi:hypothetical protein
MADPQIPKDLQGQAPDQDDMADYARRLAAEKAAGFPTVYSTTDRRPLPAQYGNDLSKAILNGTATIEADAKVPVIAPDGKLWTVPAANLKTALGKGYRIDDPNAQAARQITEEHPTWSGFVAGLHSASEGMLGIPEWIASTVDPHLDDPVIQAIRAQSLVQHPVIGGVGRVAGEVTSAIGTAGLGEAVGLGKLAVGAEEAITGAKALTEGAELAPKVASALDAGSESLAKAGATTLAEETTANVAPGVLRRMAGAGAKQAILGAGMEVPRATQQLFNGDPDRAAESLAWGAGMGFLFGTGGELAETALKGTLGAAEKFAAGRMKQLGTLGEEALPSMAQAVARKTVRWGAGAASHFVGVPGWAGYAASSPIANKAGIWAKEATEKWMESGGGKVASKWLKDLAEKPMENGFGEGMAQQAVSSMAQKLSGLPAALSQIGTGEIEAYEDRKKISDEQAGRIAAMAQQLQASPQLLTDITSDIVSPLAHSSASQQVAIALAGKLTKTISYIAAAAPKPPSPAPFTRDTWQPNPLELKSLKDKIEVAFDPTSVIRRLADGTLNQDQVDALQALYPKFMEDIKRTALDIGSNPNAPKLNVGQRQKLGLMMGVALDRLQQPQAVQQLQAAFQPPAPPPGPPPGGAGGGKGSRGPRGGTAKPGKIKLTYDKLPKIATNAETTEYGSEAV